MVQNSSQKRDRLDRISANWAGIFQFVWLTVIGGVAILSVQLYIKFARQLAVSTSDVPILGHFVGVPVVGPLISLVCTLMPDLIAIAVFSLLQFLEILPMLLESPDKLEERIMAGQRWQNLPIADTDPAWMASLKEKFNRLPITWVSRLHEASRIAYVVELLLSASAYPLFKQGWVWAFQNFSSLTLADVAWSNLPGFLLMLCALEATVWVYVWLKVGSHVINTARK